VSSNAKSGNPAPLGLAGFGLTTVLLNLNNAGIVATSVLTMCYGFFFGGLAQVLAGMIEFRRGSTFGGTAFTGYGLFWIGLALMVLLCDWLKVAPPPSPAELAAWMFMWGIFTVYLTICVLKTGPNALRVVFVTLTILFFLLSAAFAAQSQLLLHTAGYEGIICGLSAIYTSAGLIINEVYGRPVVPL